MYLKRHRTRRSAVAWCASLLVLSCCAACDVSSIIGSTSRTPPQLLKKAREEFKDGRYPAAYSYYDEYIRQIKDNGDAYLERAECAVELQMYAEAAENYDKAAELGKKPVGEAASFKRARALFGATHYKDALEALNSLIAAKPNAPEYLTLRGDVLGFLNRYEDSIADFSKAISLAPQNSAAYIGRADSEYRLGRHAKAIEDLSKAIELNAKEKGGASYDLFMRRANWYWDDGEKQKALADLNEAVKLQPDNQDVWEKRGELYASMNEHEKAIADFTRAHELMPARGYTLTLRAQSYNKLKQYQKALDDLKGDSDNAQFHEVRAEALLGLGRDADVLAEYRTDTKNDPAPYFFRANLYADRGQLQKAIDDYSTAVKLDPSNYECYVNRADAYLRSKQYQKAIDDSNKAIEILPNSEYGYSTEAKR